MGILGIDIGGTKTAVLLGTAEGETSRRAEFPTRPERGFDAFLEDLARHAKPLLADADRASISVGGPMDEARGILMGPPHLPGWTDLPLATRVQGAVGLPVAVMHDARASAFAEHRFGAGRTLGARSMAHLTFATGFGMGAVLDGRLLDIPGEVGHWRVAFWGPRMFGKTGSLEGLASGAGMEAVARMTGEFAADVDVRELARLARGGDTVALSILHSGAKQCGIQCARLIDQLGVELITLGTIAVHCPDLVMETIRQTALEEALPHLAERCRIEPAGLGARLGDVASLSAALHRGGAGAGRAAEQAQSLLRAAEKICGDADFLRSVDRAAEAVVGALKAGNKILTCGNGGSATDAAHLAEELIGRFRNDRVSLPAVNLAADGSVLTCIANDYGFEDIFARQVEGLGRPGDVLVAFTTSGRSANINRALRRAKERGVVAIALTGKAGGESRAMADIPVHVPWDETERIQEIHTFVLHAICDAAERAFGKAPETR